MKFIRILMALQIIVFLCILANVRDVKAPSMNDAEGPNVVKVGVWIISIERVDPASGTFMIDFYLWFKYEGVTPNIEFINGAPSRFDKIKERENYLEYRVKGAFIKALDFRNFPLDEHLLTVEIEDKERNASELIFEPDLDEGGKDPELTVVGWDVGDFRIYAKEHAYPDENFSRLIFELKIYRSKLSVTFKNFLPITVITLISLLTFAISVKNFGQRVGICVTTLMAAVTYHLAALSALPPFGYLTLFDRIMLVVYTLYLYNLAVSVQAMRLVEKGQVPEAEKFEARMQNLILVLVPALCLVYIGLIDFFA